MLQRDPLVRKVRCATWVGRLQEGITLCESWWHRQRVFDSATTADPECRPWQVRITGVPSSPRNRYRIQWPVKWAKTRKINIYSDDNQQSTYYWDISSYPDNLNDHSTRLSPCNTWLFLYICIYYFTRTVWTVQSGELCIWLIQSWHNIRGHESRRASGKWRRICSPVICAWISHICYSKSESGSE